MVRPEPFRAMIEQALASSEAAPDAASDAASRDRPPPLPNSSSSSSSPSSSNVALERRLDQLSLVGATPARGMRVPLHVNAPFDAPLEAPVFSTDALPPSPADFVAPTQKLERPAALDAIIQDALASFEMTREMPPQSLPSPKDFAPATSKKAPPKLAAMPELRIELEPTKPAPVSLPSPPRGVPRPPPLPKRAAKATAHAAPAPKMVQFLDENTIPGDVPISSPSHSSSSERRDAYRLHLEFDDTPARPVPALASLLPMPVEPHELLVGEPPPLVDPEQLGGVESTDLHRLDELEGIEDLDLLAQALGLRSVADVSIPSDEGEPVSDLFPAHDSLPPRRLSDEGASAVRRAAVMKALGEDEGDAQPSSSPGVRPKLAAKGAVSPVIVKIPTRPKVSAQARAQARSLYLTAVEEIGRGDKQNAMGHLKLAVHYDDGVELYRDLLAQLERTTRSGEAIASEPDDDEETPALMVVRRTSRREMRISEVRPHASRGR
jgi:hypothetical protein